MNVLILPHFWATDDDDDDDDGGYLRAPKSYNV